MNYKIAKTMLVLCIVYLVGFYILKFIFPELLLQTITSPTVLRLGEMMSKFVLLEFVLMFISNFLTFFLFSCASSGNFKFNRKQYAVILSATVINIIFVIFVPNLYTHTSISLMLICALVCKGKLKYTTISFVLHGYLSQFLFLIRGFESKFEEYEKRLGLLFDKAKEDNVKVSEETIAAFKTINNDYAKYLNDVTVLLKEVSSQIELKYDHFIKRLENTNIGGLFAEVQDMKKTINNKFNILFAGIGVAIVLTIVSFFI